MSMGLSNISAQDVVNNLSESQLKLINQGTWRGKRSFYNC